MAEVIIRFGIFGPQPPPRHGVSAVNEAMALLAVKRGLQVSLFNTAPRSLHRTASVKVARLFRALGAVRQAWSFVRREQNCTLYVSMSGGWGVLYETVCVFGARLLGAKLVLHHHSFRYLDDNFLPMKALVLAAGSQAIHVALGAEMGSKLRASYPRVRTVLILSNAFIQPSGLGEVTAPVRLAKVGYLANLSKEKGLDEVLATARLAYECGLKINFVVAGPFDDPLLESSFKADLGTYPNVKYVGPVYGASKDDFFQGIDLLIFPTRYRHEAEPLVVLEALSCSRPVIAYARGCIRDMLGDRGGCAVNRTEPFPPAAVSLFKEWQAEGDKYALRARRAREQYLELTHGSDQSITKVFS